MGLDVKLHIGVSIANPDEDYDFINWNYDDFKENSSNLVFDSCYKSKEKFWPISYSYSSHSLFRDFLCEVSGKVKEYWRSHQDKDDDFHELLFFADNQGTIDWEISEKLYHDFKKHEKAASKHENKFFREYYTAWLSLFDEARKPGNVIVFQ